MHFILPDASNAHHTIVMRPRHYMARVFALRAKSRLLGCYADNMTSTVLSFASYHQHRTDRIDACILSITARLVWLCTVQITFIFIGQTHLVFGKRVCTCVMKHSNVFRTFLNWLKNSKRVWHERKLHIMRVPLFANFDR